MKLEPYLSHEFNRQIENLVEKGYPKVLRMSAPRFRSLVEPLRDHVCALHVPSTKLESGRLASVIVIKCDQIGCERAMSLVEYGRRNGSTKMYPRRTGDFRPVEGVDIPNGIAYLLVDVERGERYAGLPPQDALIKIRARRRSPLTIDEGIAVVTQYPELLERNKCFSLLASRCAGDRRVPAIWINHENQAHLGWCWDGNPHSWLGSASCRGRVGA